MTVAKNALNDEITEASKVFGLKVMLPDRFAADSCKSIIISMPVNVNGSWTFTSMYDERVKSEAGDKCASVGLIVIN